MSAQGNKIVCSVPAVRYRQRTQTMFLAAFPAAALLRVARVDHWDPKLGSAITNGYQRTPEPKRLSAIAKFISQPGAFFSTGGLLNARLPVGDPASPIAFEPAWEHDSGEVAFGKLFLRDTGEPLWVVDMQHRLESLRKAISEGMSSDLATLPVACTIASGMSRAQEIQEFLQINTKQKKVATALARRALAALNTDAVSRAELARTGKLWEARGPVVVDLLMEHSPVWAGRITPPNTTKREYPTGVIRETSFVSSLESVLQDDRLGAVADATVADYLKRYWEALATIWPVAIGEPKRHVIQQNPGVNPLHRLMPRVFALATTGAKTPDVADIVDVIEGWRALGDKYWLKQGSGAGALGSSEGAFKQISNVLEPLLP